MKMNEIIRERRLKKGLTQEQMANYLGVSAPAVNKWEKGTTYPDIVLLPVRARLLDTLPNKDFFDKKQLQISLWTESGKLDEAVKLAEEQLLMMTNDMHFLLMSLMEIAIKEERNEDAEYIAEVYKKAANLFGLWEYTSYVAHFQLYAATKHRMKSSKK